MNEHWIKLDSPNENGSTHQCVDGPFCWMYGTVFYDMFIPWSG